MPRLSGTRFIGRVSALLGVCLLAWSTAQALPRRPGLPGPAVTTHTQLFSKATHATSAVCTGGNIIVQGSFEDATGDPPVSPSWTGTDVLFGSPLCSTTLPACADDPNATPRTGTTWMFVGGNGVTLETASVTQSVTFPPAGATVTLNYYLWIGQVATPFTDTLEVKVDGVTKQTITEPAVAEPGYTLRSLDLSSFADGTAHSIQFFYTQPVNGGQADFSVDDITLDVVCPGFEFSPASLQVDPALTVANGDHVFEMNEGDVVVAPGWNNDGVTDFALTGTASNLAGGTGTTNTIPDSSADYGVIASGGTADCLAATGDCYAINVTGVRTAQPVHFDLSLDETVVAVPPVALTNGPPPPPSKTWTIHVGNSFSDVDTNTVTDPFYRSIETILHKGVTSGCGATSFCPLQNTLRQEMAVFLLKAKLGAAYTPPVCTPPGQFADVACPGQYTDFIEDLKTRGITAGCHGGGDFCPVDNVLRQEMAVFLLKTLQGAAYAPPACTPPGQFADVACPGQYTNFIEDLKTRGITAGCHGGTDFCPTDPVTRQEMAAFLTNTFTLVLYGP